MIHILSPEGCTRGFLKPELNLSVEGGGQQSISSSWFMTRCVTEIGLLPQADFLSIKGKDGFLFKGNMSVF